MGEKRAEDGRVARLQTVELLDPLQRDVARLERLAAQRMIQVPPASVAPSSPSRTSSPTASSIEAALTSVGHDSAAMVRQESEPAAES